MKYLALISILLVACDAGPAQLNEVAKAPNECPEPSAKLDVAKARFREHLPKADPSQYEIKSGVFSGKIVYSFVPTSAYRTFGDSPSVVFDCVSQTALFLPGE